MTSRHISTVFLTILLIQVQNDVGRGNEIPAPGSILISCPVSLGDGDYVLVAKNGRELSLRHHQRSGETSEWKVNPITAWSPHSAPDDSLPQDGKTAKITQVALARFVRQNLMAVVKVSQGEEAVFWWLKFAPMREPPQKDDELAPNAFVVTRGTVEDRVLALSGDLDPRTFVTLVTGKLSADFPGDLERGAIVFDGCGFLEYGRVGRFELKYSPYPVPAKSSP